MKPFEAFSVSSLPVLYEVSELIFFVTELLYAS